MNINEWTSELRNLLIAGDKKDFCDLYKIYKKEQKKLLL